QSITAVKGQSFTGRQIATITDANAGAAPSPFDVVLDWGDGSVPQDLGNFTATGGTLPLLVGHTYQAAGVFGVRIELRRPTPDNTVLATLQSTAVVQDDLAIPSHQVPGQGGVEGQPIAVTVATFPDTNPDALARDFVAQIDWGDTTFSPGVVTGP